MTREELANRFPSASQSFPELNADSEGDVSGRTATGVEAGREVSAQDECRLGKASELERRAFAGAVGALQIQAGLGKRHVVRITSIRRRLLDEDNLCEKFFIDLLRHAGAIPGDAPGQTKIEVAQQKAGKGEPEEVRIEVFEL